MGKVIWPDCWHEKKVIPLSNQRLLQKLDASESEKRERVVYLDICFYSESEKHKTLVKQALDYGNGMIGYIGSKLSGFSLDSGETTMRQQTFSATPLEALCTNVLSSREFQWQRKPIYYGALFLELTKRASEVESRLLSLNDPKSS